MAVSPSDTNVILAGIEFGAVIRSEDGGETWSPGLVIGALKNGQVWASEDHGDSWNLLPIDLGPIGLGLMALG